MPRRAEGAPGQQGVPLTLLKTGSRAAVLSLASASPQERSKLMALGVLPGVSLHLLQRFPSYVISVGYTQLTLDRETASAILVRPE